MGNSINTDKYVGIGLRGIIAPSIDADATAFLTASAITGATQQAAIDNLVKGLKSDGLWSKMKAVYPFVTDNRNLLGYTEDFADATWFKAAASITSNTATAPNGTLTADTFTSTATSATHVVVRAISLSSTFTYSLYVKKAAQRYVSIKCALNTSTWTACNYDLDTATVTKTGQSTITGTTGTITSVGSGWYRLTLTATGAIGDCAIQYSNTDNPTFQTFGDIIATGSGVADYYLWGAQIELGSTATTYQPIATTQQAYIASQFKYNLKDPRDLDAAFRLVFNGGWTHSSTGATPNGTNGYADTKFNQAANLSNDSVHLSYYSRTNSIVNSFDIGGNSGSPSYQGAQLAAYYTAIGSIGHLHSYPTDSTVSTATTDTRAFYLASRISSTSNKLFRNSTLLATNTTSRTSTLANITFRLASDMVGFTNRQAAFTTIGDGLTDTEAANLYSRVQQYQTTLNRQV